MKKLIRAFILLVFSFSIYACSAQENTSTKKYTFKSGDPNGIGKWYMDREIAHVMGFQGMPWLERPERESEEKTSLLLENMDIQENDVIADIGAGSGYHVFKMAPIVKEGRIYAVDIQDEMLEAIRARMQKSNVENVELVKGSETNVSLPVNSISKVLLVDVYHEFSYPAEVMTSIVKALKPHGQIYLIEYRGEDESVPIKKVHKMTEAQAIKELKAAGLKLKENIPNLPWQHCMVFVKE